MCFTTRNGLRPLVVIRGEDVTAHAQEAPLPENGGVTESGGGATAPKQSLDHASPGKGRGGILENGGEQGITETEELDTMSEVSFATAASQGYRTEDEEVPTFEVSMVQLGWQNDELVSDRWVKIGDQPEVRVMQLTKREEDSDTGNDEGALKKKNDREKKPAMIYCRDWTSNKQTTRVGGGIVSIESSDFSR